VQPNHEGQGAQRAGYACAFLSLVMPFIGLAGLILGIITASKRGRGGHGAAIIVLSIFLAGASFAFYYERIMHREATSAGACYYTLSGERSCP